MRTEKILGINFHIGSANEVLEFCCHNKGLVIAPSAPSLVDGFSNKYFYMCMINANHAIVDSALIAIMWSLYKIKLTPKVSGLKYTKLLISNYLSKELEKTFWIMPTRDSSKKLISYFSHQSLNLQENQIYVAPKYRSGEIMDDELITQIEKNQPTHIVIGLGGGTQERVGYLIKTRFGASFTIHCIGAAIGFITGDQVKIPEWADRTGLGWLMRCISNPVIYGKRYLKALKIIPIFIWFRQHKIYK